MKRKFLATLGALSPFGAFAATQGDYTTALTSLKEEATGLVGQVSPIVVDIVIALFVFVAIGLVWKLIKRFLNKG